MVKAYFLLTCPNKNPTSLLCPCHFQWIITIARTSHPVCTVPYERRVQKHFSHIMTLDGALVSH